MTRTILITAASGTIGSALRRRLPEYGVHARPLVRDARPDLLARAVHGMDAVFLACGNVPQQVEFECAVIDAAARAGVRRIVKLSARGAASDASVAYWRWHAQIEDHLRASRVPAVVLRPGFLMTNLLAATDHVRDEGMLFAPAGDAAIAMIDPEDVAAVAAVALTRDGHDGRTYTLTGPAAISYHQVAADLAAAVGHPVGYLDVPPEAARASLLAAGLPMFAADQIVAVFGALRGGAQARATDTVRELIGREPSSFAAWAASYARAFRMAG